MPLQPAEGLSVSRDGALRAVGETGSDPFDGRPSREGVLVRNLRDRYPWVEIRNLTPVLDAARLLKSPREIALVRRATRLACLSILEAMRSTEPGIYEHELDGVSRFVYYRHGAQGEAYYSLVASGENAWYPHYSSGKRHDEGRRDGADGPRAGRRLLHERHHAHVAGERALLAPSRRELYGFYLATYRAILKAIRPGVTKQAVMEEAAAEMDADRGRERASRSRSTRRRRRSS